MRLVSRLVSRNAWRTLSKRVSSLVLLSVLCAVGRLAHGQAVGERVATEDAVKAAYLYKLRNYVEWPAAPGKGSGKMTIGVIGADDIVERLQDLPDVRDRAKGTVSIKHLRIGDSLDGLSILFIDDAYWRKSGSVVAQATAQSILIVTESPNALRAGSMVNFQLVDERIRFEVSLNATEQAGLKLSSQLLALAVSVLKEKHK